jgi:antitoxin (DNA-binding transcriptional repressor) of toxin-antitoxin stability system
MTRVSVHEAKAHFSSILKAVEAGDVVIVTRHDKAVVEMRSFVEREKPKLGSFAEDGPTLSVDWTEEELDELFNERLDGS